MKTHVSVGEDAHALVSAMAAAAGPNAAVRLIFAFYGCDADDQALHAALSSQFPDATWIGGTSSGGVLSNEGVRAGRQFGLLAIDDDDGDYGVCAMPLGNDPVATAQAALSQALHNAGCDGELPELIWIYQPPGREEQVLEGLRQVVGDRCAIVGGSSADDAVSGRWRQFGPQGPALDTLVVAVLFPSTPVRYAFQGGYEPAGPSGIVTGVAAPAGADDALATQQAGRSITTIDGEPAAAVYNRWSEGCIAGSLATGGSVLASTTLFPLATVAGNTGGLTQFLLMHPEGVLADGTLRMFCEVQVGDRVYAMRGDRQRLVERAGRVAEQACKALPGTSAPVGALMVYCGGCKLAVGDRIGEVVDSVRDQLAGAPFVGCFTFGEQGRMLDSNLHGNLMISAVVFGA